MAGSRRRQAPGPGRRRASSAATASGGSPACPTACSCGCRTSASNYRTVKTWFVDPVRRVAVPDLRYLPGSTGARAGRAGDGAAVRRAVDGAAGRGDDACSPPDAQLRSNVATSPEGALIVDLTQVGELDEAGRRLLAAQVVLSLAEVSVGPGPAARRRRAAAAGPPRPDPGRRGVADRRAARRRRCPPWSSTTAGCTSSTAGSSTPRCPGRSATASWPCSRRRRARTGGAWPWSPRTVRRRRLLIGGADGPAVRRSRSTATR